MLIWVKNRYDSYFTVPSLCVHLLFLGAFLLPYCVLVVILGIPMFLLETAIGQYSQQGFITCWNKLCPLGKGECFYSKIKDPVSQKKKIQ